MNPAGDQRSSEADRNAARAIINSPVFANAFGRRWADIADEGHMKRLEAGASVAVAGFCHYLGNQIRALRDNGVFRDDDLETIRLCFGGRGSTLFKWWNEQWQGIRMFTRLTEGNAVVSFSEEMKHEVAKGMLAGTPGQNQHLVGDSLVMGIAAKFGKGEDATSVEATTYLADIDVEDAPELARDEFFEFVMSVARVRITGHVDR